MLVIPKILHRARNYTSCSNQIIQKLKNKLPADEKKKILDESGGVSEWIYSALRKLWFLIYPLFPDHTFLDEVNMILGTHSKMVEKYGAEPPKGERRF
jgi:hypothetical protein